MDGRLSTRELDTTRYEHSTLCCGSNNDRFFVFTEVILFLTNAVLLPDSFLLVHRRRNRSMRATLFVVTVREPLVPERARVAEPASCAYVEDHEPVLSHALTLGSVRMCRRPVIAVLSV